MAGLVQRIVPLQQFDSGSAITSTSTIICFSARRIDASRWREADIVCRLHATTNWANGTQLQFFVAPDGYTDEDPNQAWQVPQGGVCIGFTQGGPTNDTAPSVRVGSIGTTLGLVPNLVQVQVRLTGGGVANRITLVASCDINLKGE
jgi:hypothetical protein